MRDAAAEIWLLNLCALAVALAPWLPLRAAHAVRQRWRSMPTGAGAWALGFALVTLTSALAVHSSLRAGRATLPSHPSDGVGDLGWPLSILDDWRLWAAFELPWLFFAALMATWLKKQLRRRPATGMDTEVALAVLGTQIVLYALVSRESATEMFGGVLWLVGLPLLIVLQVLLATCAIIGRRPWVVRAARVMASVGLALLVSWPLRHAVNHAVLRLDYPDDGAGRSPPSTRAEHRTQRIIPQTQRP